MTTLLVCSAGGPVPVVAAYGLSRPTADDAMTSIHRVYEGAEAEQAWTVIRTGPPKRTSIEDIIGAMIDSADGIVRLCGQALDIRLRTYTHLAATHGIIS